MVVWAGSGNTGLVPVPETVSRSQQIHRVLFKVNKLGIDNGPLFNFIRLLIYFNRDFTASSPA